MDLLVEFESFVNALSLRRWQELLLTGLLNTVKIAVFGLLIGIVIGTIIAAVRVAPKYKLIIRILDKICSVYVAIFRGTPMVVQLLLFYYVIFGNVLIKPVVVGYIVFGLNSGAYVSEIMRGGINSVDSGQMEAGRAVGLGYGTVMLKIVIPQAIKNIVPTLGNEFISLIKETSVVSFISINDLYVVIVQKIALSSYSYMFGYIFLALIYIILVAIITILIRCIEKFFAKSDRKISATVSKKQRVKVK